MSSCQLSDLYTWLLTKSKVKAFHSSLLFQLVHLRDEPEVLVVKLFVQLLYPATNGFLHRITHDAIYIGQERCSH